MMANRAVSIGRAAANSAPNATSSTTRAKTIPMAVLGPEVGACAFSMSWPPSATSRSAVRAEWAALITASTADYGLAPGWPSNTTVAKAILPSRLICCAALAPYGLTTARTWGTRATWASMAWARAITAGSVTLPDLAASTIWSVLPEAIGKSFCNSCRASADWVCGSWNLVAKFVPAAEPAPTVATTRASHPARTIQRCLKHQRAKVDNSASGGDGGSRRYTTSDPIAYRKRMKNRGTQAFRRVFAPFDDACPSRLFDAAERPGLGDSGHRLRGAVHGGAGCVDRQRGAALD